MGKGYKEENGKNTNTLWAYMKRSQSNNFIMQITWDFFLILIWLAKIKEAGALQASQGHGELHYSNGSKAEEIVTAIWKVSQNYEH